MLDLGIIIAFLGKAFILLLAGLVVFLICCEVRNYRLLDHFRKQGVLVKYIPLIGFGRYRIVSGSGDDLATLRDMVEKNKNEDMVTFNYHEFPYQLTIINEDSLIRDFLAKEVQCTEKFEIVKEVNVGYFFGTHKSALEGRAIFSDFFKYENLKVLTNSVNKVIMRNLLRVRDGLEKKDDWNKVFIKRIFTQLLNEITYSILIGEEEEQTVDGQSITLAIQSYVILASNQFLNIWNTLSAGKLHEWNLLKESREARRLYKEITEGVLAFYEKRKNAGPKGIPNVMDLLIDYNEGLKKEGKEPISTHDLVGHFNLLQFASIDTSLEVTTTGAFQLSKHAQYNKDYTGIIRKILKGKGLDYSLTYEDIDNEDLDMYMNEMLRLGAPFVAIMPRIFTKPASLGKYQFRKNDLVVVLSQTAHTTTKDFEKPMEFIPERMTKEKMSEMKKTAFLPFGHGRRGCLGKSLGEIIVKSVIVNMFRVFEVAHDAEASEDKIWKSATYGYKDPSILLKPRTTVL